MIQDIFPSDYDNSYRNVSPEDKDLVVMCNSQRLIYRLNGSEAELPTVGMLRDIWKADISGLRYLFSAGSKRFFLYREEAEERDGFVRDNLMVLRGLEPAYVSFAAAVGAHLAHWYDNNIYCGKCGDRLIHKETERALVCPKCGNTVFPRINPIIIAAVTDKDRLLVAKYNKKHFNTRNNQYVLLAGYVEIGESYEDTLRREVMEETGLRVKNIRYVTSQPWPFSQTSIAGFYAEADSTLPLKIQEDELSELVWIERDKLPARKNRTSITDNLIEWFRHGKSIEEIRDERDAANEAAYAAKNYG